MNPYDDSTSQQLISSVLGGFGGLVLLVVYVLYVIALWRVFSKAGWPGILALIPIVNVFILVKIAGYSAWLGLLYVIPIVNVVFHFFVSLRVGRNFGHGTVFSIILVWWLSMIGFFVIGFSDDTYRRRD